jgi:hypothetical protein
MFTNYRTKILTHATDFLEYLLYIVWHKQIGNLGAVSHRKSVFLTVPVDIM